jgi:hypothetical protein
MTTDATTQTGATAAAATFDHALGERRDAARRLLAAGEPARAAEALEGVADGDPGGEALVLLGDASFLAGRYDRAEAAWRAALAACPDDAILAGKLERAAAAVLTDAGATDAQSAIFRRLFTAEYLLAGPHPGDVAGSGFAIPADDPDLIERLLERIDAGAGAALGAVGRAVFSRLVHRAGASGVDDGVWTNWHTTGEELPEKLRGPLQILKLAYMRETLFANNLVRPYVDGQKTGFWVTDDGPPAWARHWRTADGSWNDLRKDADGRYDPMVGAAWTRFFRNVGDARGLEATRPRANPGTNPVSVRELSRQLLAPVGERQLVPFLNLWAAAWIQFMVHDWVSHGTPDFTRVDRIPLADDDPLRRYGVATLDVPATHADPTRTAVDGDRPPTAINEVTHWWDGSQLYGSDELTQRALRSGHGGKLRLTDEGTLPIDPATGVEATGFVRNWWLGLAMMHTLFAREHNAICEHLAARHPGWDDERLFQTARLVNAALMAKLHTVEWTPAILANRTLYDAMHANWYGLLTSWFGGERKHTVEPIAIDSPELGGIVGGPQGTFARYGLSEEFTAVYRLHALLPDAFELLRADGPPLAIPLLRTRGKAVAGILREHGLAATAASMGVQHPGALVANNYPAALLDLTVPGQPVTDLGAIDLYRDRERGVPRYNELRLELGLERVPGFDALTPDAGTAARLRACYGVDADGNDRIDDVDLLIGTLAEGHRPHGFGFGETLFQVFILNASWRLLGDRFYTSDYRPAIYTQEGLDWIDRTTFKDVLLRHLPELYASGLGNVRNAFEPWDEGTLDPARHPTRAFVKELADDPWRGERARAGDG